MLTDCFTDLEQGCDERYRSGGDRDKEAEINRLGPILEDLYRTVLSRAPAARVVVLTYPQIMTETDSCFEQFVLSDSEKRWIRLRTAQLASVTTGAIDRVADSRLISLDLLGAFADAGHGVCNKERPYVNGFSLDDTSSSFHPTTEGYRVEAEALYATVGPVVP